MEPLCDRPPNDPRKFNLLGLALLQDKPRQAVGSFRRALRCDLRYEPAYLNLAQAYDKLGETSSATECLRRYLRLMPQGKLAGDARQRLAALEPTR